MPELTRFVTRESAEALRPRLSRLLAESAADQLRNDDVTGLPEYGLPRVGLLMGNVAFCRRDYRSAVSYYELGLSVDVEDAILRSHLMTSLALALLEIDQGLGGLPWLDRVVLERPSWATGHYNRAFLLHRLARHEEAVKSISEAMRLGLTSAEVLQLRGNALVAMRRYDEAMECYAINLGAAPASVDDLNNAGCTRIYTGQLLDAVGYFDRALGADPYSVKALTHKGLALLGLGETDRAVECFSQAIALQPSCKQAWLNKGLAYAATGRFAEAIMCFDSALAQDQTFIEALANKGLALCRLGRHDEAMTTLRRRPETTGEEAWDRRRLRWVK